MGIGTRLIAGAMSGTSADGVDIAIVRIDGTGLEMAVQLVHHHSVAFDPKLRAEILDIRSRGDVKLADLGRICRGISMCYARAVNEALSGANLESNALAAIAAHGQTMFHAPPDTIQIFDPSLVSVETGCAVVSDFRRADLAVGGQGAPLVPFADYILFRHPTKNRVILNIGGIANLTYLKAAGSFDEVIAFDTGPGNCVSDWLCRKHYPHGSGYDENGKIARHGKIYSEVVRQFLAHPYFSKPPPKSTDGPAMIRAFEEAVAVTSINRIAFIAESQIATATDCTVHSIIRSLGTAPEIASSFESLDELIVSGGGSKNQYMFDRLSVGFRAGALNRCTVMRSDSLGVASDSKEAIAFALLGAATLDGLPSNVPSATGAKRPVVLGSITNAH